MRNEDQLLILLAKIKLADNELDKVEELISKDFDWTYCLESAIEHRISQFCYHHFFLSDLPRMRHIAQLLPKETINLFELEYQKLIQTNTNLLNEIKNIVAFLNKHRLNYIILKGPALIRTIYQEALWPRPFGDLDILIFPEDIELATRILNDLGYIQGTVSYAGDRIVPFPPGVIKEGVLNRLHLHHFRKIDGITIEVHPRLEVPSAPFDFEVRGVFERSQQIEISNGIRARILCPEDCFIFLCLHLSREARLLSPHILRNGDLSIMKFCDIYELLRFYRQKIDWSKLSKIINRDRLEDPVFFTLFFLMKIYEEADLPSEFLKKIQPDDMKFLNQFQTVLYQSETYEWESDFFQRLFDRNRSIEAQRIVFKQRNCPQKLICKNDSPSIKIDDIVNNKASNMSIGDINYSQKREKSDENLNKKKAVFHTYWDSKFFYFVIKVNDNNVVVPEGDHPVFFRDRDAVRLHFSSFDMTKDLLHFLSYPTKEVGSENLYQELHRNYGIFCRVSDSKVNSKILESCYILEIAIPFGVLDINPKINKTILFNVEIMECNDRNTGVNKYYTWSGEGSRIAYDRSLYGTLEFV